MQMHSLAILMKYFLKENKILIRSWLLSNKNYMMNNEFVQYHFISCYIMINGYHMNYINIQIISMLNSFIICCFIWNQILSAWLFLVSQTVHYKPIHFNSIILLRAAIIKRLIFITHSLYSYITNYTCMGDKEEVLDSRQSFPSGHASFSMYVAIFFSVSYLLF